MGNRSVWQLFVCFSFFFLSISGAYQQDLAKASAQKSELESELAEAQDKLAKAERERAETLDKKRRHVEKTYEY